MRFWALACVIALLPAPAVARDADLTILVDGQLFELGGVVEVLAVAEPGATGFDQEITLQDRFARITLTYAPGATYRYRFRPAPAAMAQPGATRFLSEALTVGGRDIGEGDDRQSADYRAIRVFPHAEYAEPGSIESILAAWGDPDSQSSPPPANHWGARSLAGVFDDRPWRPSPRLTCRAQGDQVSVCTPDPADALLMQALWWESIAMSRLERLRHDALRGCYESRGTAERPRSCAPVAGRGWPAFEPDD